MRTNLTEAQEDYAHFLPALSSFYGSYVGKQRFTEAVPNDRIPSNFNNGVESLNYLNAKEGQFQYKWTLYSAGHADLDVNKDCPKEDMVRNRDRENTFILGDSGGFQISKGVWPADWKDPNCPRAEKKRMEVIKWMDKYMDYGMVLDVPTSVTRHEKGRQESGITTHQEALLATKINNDHWMRNRTGECKLLNVLQGLNHTDADFWYEQVKEYSDPKKYPDSYFEGFAFGGQNMVDSHLMLKRFVTMKFDGFLQQGIHDLVHVLGISKVEWALMLTDVQRAIRKSTNPDFMVTFDCASPFLATANGQVYMDTIIEDRKKWKYLMKPGIDDKSLARSNMSFKDAILNAGLHDRFIDSPISDGLKVSDICHYAPGDLNKIGKEGKTSWDSFSYAIQMGHNVWSHINTIQEANRQYDAGICPKMLVDERFDRTYTRDVIEAIFETDDRDKALALVDEFSRMWMSIPGGQRGFSGKKTVNPTTFFNHLFETPEAEEEDIHEDGEFTEDEEHVLEELEERQDS